MEDFIIIINIYFENKVKMWRLHLLFQVPRVFYPVQYALCRRVGETT